MVHDGRAAAAKDRGERWTSKELANDCERTRSNGSSARIAGDVSRRRRSRAHCAHQTANSGGGRRGARVTLSGAVGANSTAIGIAAFGALTVGDPGEGAWQEPPHPQSKPPDSLTADTVPTDLA